ncbi:hypothetical protein KF840_20350 [bacterium]|nr:hypothetical protein [bacterium]
MPSPRRPVLVAAAGYAGFTLLALALHGGSPLWFVWIGERWSEGVVDGRTGYDGQFVYYLARDGWAAIPHLDAPGYRMARILYPLLAAGLSGGHPALLPWAMLAINYLAVVAGTALLARWLAARDTSPWWALAYAGGAGLLFAYSRDCTEPLAYGLAAAGAIAWLERRLRAGGILLALAPLARESAVLFAAALAAAALARRRWGDALALAATALPILAWQAYLIAALPGPATGVASLLQLPLAGAFPIADADPGRLAALVLVALPLAALAPGALAWIVREPASPFAWLIALNALLVLSAPAQTYLHVLALARVGLGAQVALLLAFPLLSRELRAAVAAFAVAPILIWLAPMLWWAPWTAVR